MKTTKEMIARIKKIKDSKDPFGVERNDLIEALPPEAAALFYKDDRAFKIAATFLPLYSTDTEVASVMYEYLFFAYDKAYSERGLSANRNISHFLAWSFLIDDELHATIERMYNTEYSDYGLHILRHIDTWLQENHGCEAVDHHPATTSIP